jgi:flavin-dependent dehydrogenase
VFKKHTELDIRQPRKSGGSGGDLAAFWNSHTDFVIGEAAGFQDFLWGFGIRHALTSGYLAAQAILEGRDFQDVADEKIRPLVRASLVNRWLYDKMPNRGLATLIGRFGTDPDLNALVGRWYHPRRIHHLLWPLAARHFRRQAAALAGHGRYSNRTRRRHILITS